MKNQDQQKLRISIIRLCLAFTKDIREHREPAKVMALVCRLIVYCVELFGADLVYPILKQLMDEIAENRIKQVAIESGHCKFCGDPPIENTHSCKQCVEEMKYMEATARFETHTLPLGSKPF